MKIYVTVYVTNKGLVSVICEKYHIHRIKSLELPCKMAKGINIYFPEEEIRMVNKSIKIHAILLVIREI